MNRTYVTFWDYYYSLKILCYSNIQNLFLVPFKYSQDIIIIF
jgi:hypothetical protein